MRPLYRLDLRREVPARDRERPLVTGANDAPNGTVVGPDVSRVVVVLVLDVSLVLARTRHPSLPQPDTDSGSSCISRSILEPERQQRTGIVRADLPFFRPDISPVGSDRASVMRCRRSLLSAGGCCCCCQRLVLVPISKVSLVP